MSRASFPQEVSRKRGERGATIIMTETSAGRFSVEVIGSDGVTESFYQNKNRSQAESLVQEELDRDTDEYLAGPGE